MNRAKSSKCSQKTWRRSRMRLYDWVMPDWPSWPIQLGKERWTPLLDSTILQGRNPGPRPGFLFLYAGQVYSSGCECLLGQGKWKTSKRRRGHVRGGEAREQAAEMGIAGMPRNLRALGKRNGWLTG